VLIVTDLLIPRQTGTSDSCGATNEEDIFEYQHRNGLITLGWIHVRAGPTSWVGARLAAC